MAVSQRNKNWTENSIANDTYDWHLQWLAKNFQTPQKFLWKLYFWLKLTHLNQQSTIIFAEN